jgi:catechol 2,3-dioxygenase-like lactoylglutathione lyase family enzyme
MSLSSAKIAANVPVSDLGRAVAFYQDKLGLKVMPLTEWLAIAVADDGSVLALARRPTAPTGQDIANFTVTDIVRSIAELSRKGVVFESYDLPHLKTVDHIARADGFSAAWFKDTEGNLLQINQSPTA